MKRQLTAHAALLACVVAACDGGERPRLAIATNLEFSDAAALAVADGESAWGPLPGDTIIALETLTRAAVAIENASDMAARGVDAVVGHSNSAASLASAPIYNENAIVQLSPQSSASAYSEAGPYSFRLVPPDDRQGEFIARSLREMTGVQRIVVLYVNDDYGRGLHTALLRALGPGGPEVVGQAPHLERTALRPEDLDLARRVVSGATPDAIVWLGRPLILEQYLHALRPLMGEMPVVASDAVALANRYGSSSLWNNVWYVDFVDLEGSPEIVAFSERFEATFGRPASAADALTYDATRMLLEAMHDEADTGAEIRAWLESLGRARPAYDGITGPIRFDDHGDVYRSYVLRHFPASSAPPLPLPSPVAGAEGAP